MVDGEMEIMKRGFVGGLEGGGDEKEGREGGQFPRKNPSNFTD